MATWTNSDNQINKTKKKLNELIRLYNKHREYSFRSKADGVLLYYPRATCSKGISNKYIYNSSYGGEWSTQSVEQFCVMSNNTERDGENHQLGSAKTPYRAWQVACDLITQEQKELIEKEQTKLSNYDDLLALSKDFSPEIKIDYEYFLQNEMRIFDESSIDISTKERIIIVRFMWNFLRRNRNG